MSFIYIHLDFHIFVNYLLQPWYPFEPSKLNLGVKSLVKFKVLYYFLKREKEKEKGGKSFINKPERKNFVLLIF